MTKVRASFCIQYGCNTDGWHVATLYDNTDGEFVKLLSAKCRMVTHNKWLFLLGKQETTTEAFGSDSEAAKRQLKNMLRERLFDLVMQL